MSQQQITHPDALLIDHFREGDQTVLKDIYSRYFPGIKQLIQTNRGSLDDAKDVFQDALMVIYRKSLQPDFTLTVSFYTYLYSVCRKLWLKQLRRQSTRNEVAITDTMDFIEDGIREAIVDNEQYSIYQEKFRLLGQECQQLLRLFMEGISIRNLTEMLGYNSEAYTKKRKFLCKEKLVALIEHDPRYKDLQE